MFEVLLRFTLSLTTPIILRFALRGKQGIDDNSIKKYALINATAANIVINIIFYVPNYATLIGSFAGGFVMTYILGKIIIGSPHQYVSKQNKPEPVQPKVQPTTDIVVGPHIRDEKRDAAQLEINKATQEPVDHVNVKQVVKPMPEIKPGPHLIKGEEAKAQEKINLAMATKKDETAEMKEKKYEKGTIPVEDLKILKQLFEEGIITDKEFSEKKKQLLGL